MKIWDILKRENIGKKYEVKIHGNIPDIVKVDYDVNSDSWLTVKNTNKEDVKFPLHSLYLEVILKLEFKEVQ